MLLCFTIGALAQNRTFTAPLDNQPVTNAIIDARVDSIMNQAIEAKAFPGATLLVAKSGSIIFNKTYGFYLIVKNELFFLAVQSHGVRLFSVVFWSL